MTTTNEGRAAIRLFDAASVTALLVSLGAHAAQLLFGSQPLALFVCNFAIILGLALIAVRAHRASGGEFDSAVAAETIVAFGVLALILGLATAIAPLLALGGTTLRFDGETLVLLGAPFVQGLAAAGLAPVVAVLLRNFSAEHGGGESTEDELRLLAQAVARLTGELGRAKATAAELATALESAAHATERLGPNLASHLDAVAVATGQIGPRLTAGATALGGALDQSGRRLADELDDAGSRFAARLGDAGTRVDALATAVKGGTGELGALAGELARVRAGSRETADLLEAMAEMIASVERFVAARGTTP